MRLSEDQMLAAWQRLNAEMPPPDYEADKRMVHASQLQGGTYRPRAKHPRGWPPQQAQIIDMIAQGLTFAEIAARFGVSKSVVSGFCHHRKIRASDIRSRHAKDQPCPPHHSPKNSTPPNTAPAGNHSEGPATGSPTP